ncbi:MAG TPA: VWA domain-containing protein [Flavobacteriaceae bacterium]|jgi:Ca-activated chloride channel family protein|nr:VWA domain-containing protein [Flavobacteriaceae bacterium]HEX5742599.1 VWA domain-containing protein [Flavobacteriaceae bacterium]
MKWFNYEIMNPEFLWLLIIIPLVALWFYFTRNKSQATLTIPSIRGFEQKPSIWSRLKPLIVVLRLVAIALLILAMTRPRIVEVSTKTKTTRGIDIVMAIDISASMLAKDLNPNRLEALKKVAIEFVKGRPNDRIGVVVYAGESYTKTPITSDKEIVSKIISELSWGNNLDVGTAIGMGLGSAVNRLKESKAQSKVIILLTDGVNNAGFVDPKTSTELAKELGIKVYTIGIGTNGIALSPYYLDASGKLVFKNVPVEIDEELLRYIANQTEGKYFRATDNVRLKAIYDEINKLEKTEIEEFRYYNYSEKYRLLVGLALMFIMLEMGLRLTVYRSLI